LADNGGATETHALLPGSQAIDRGGGVCPATDQRALTRPAGPACDIGAYESEGAAPLSGAPPEGAVIQDATCRSGPHPAYLAVDYFEAGWRLLVLGRDEKGEWIEAARQGTGPPTCWIRRTLVDLTPAEVSDLPLGKVPPPPTATPRPADEDSGSSGPQGCLWYNQQQQLVCYRIAQCPVPFGQSQGACSP
jgi:hypothetical protein